MSISADARHRLLRCAVNLASRLGKEHRDWSWQRIANEARRRAGLDPAQPGKQG